MDLVMHPLDSEGDAAFMTARREGREGDGGNKRVEDIATLVRNPLLVGLGFEDIGALLEHLEVVTIAAGTLFDAASGAGEALSFVLEGRVRLRSEGAAGVELLPSSDFGALSLVDAASGPIHVEAMTKVRLARLSRAGLERLGRAHPAAALHLGNRVLSRIAKEVVELRARSLPETSTPQRKFRFDSVKIAGQDGSTIPVGTRVAEIVPDHVEGALVVGATLDHAAVSLAAPVWSDAGILPLTTQNWEGREIFRRTAGLLLLEAAQKAGCEPLQLGPSITSGRIVLLREGIDRMELAARLQQEMTELIQRDLRVREERWRLDDAVAHFVAQGWGDAATLAAFWQNPVMDVVSLGSVIAPSPGPMLPSTRMLEGISVLVHPLGLVLDFGPAIRRELPKASSSTRELEMRAPRYGSDMTRRGLSWLVSIGATSVGEFDRACVSGRVKELIEVSEGFHEKRIAMIADEVKWRSGCRVVCVGGPSSSGKTTFIKRLKVQLLVNGIRPLELSLDDYYVDREKAPRDASGASDLEVLEALDRRLLRHHVTRLLAGEKVCTAHYDFQLGKSFPEGGAERALGPRDILLVEGIHALNPELFDGAAAKQAFRIFVHPATAIPFDRLSIFEPADVRLLRRIVRDRHQRGFPAWDNLERWASVRRAERMHIYPHQGEADAVFDSSLVYEVSVLRVYAERYLLEVPRTHPEFSAAYRLRRLLSQWVPIHPDHVPPTSILREFIGGSGFEY
jgi:uridine kinase